MDENDRPSFGVLFRSEMIRSIETGFGRLVPWIMLGCVGIGFGAARYASSELFQQGNAGTLATIYGGIVTFNGITLALTWSAIGKVYDTVARPDFSRFLRASKILSTYLFYVSLVHTVQVTSAVAAVLGLVSVFQPLPPLVSRIAFGVVVATTLYAIRWAAGSAKIVQDLAWHYATFDELSPEERKRLYVVAGMER
jgi:hypothetical protein